jgi:tetratricopeptide (TPR) repeat protein
MCRAGTRACAAAYVLAAVAFASTAAAGPDITPAEARLDGARAQIANSDYGNAQPLLAEALASGEYRRDDLVELYKLTGIAAGALGDTDAATDAFAHALALAPDTQLPPGTSPKIKRPFTAAAQQLAGRTLRATARARRGAAATDREPADTLALVLDDDPLAMVVGAVVTIVVDRAAPRVVTAPRATSTSAITVALPAGDHVEVRAALVDARGNRLLELAPITLEHPPAPTGVAPATLTASAAAPIYLRWYTYAAPTAVALAFAVGYGLATRSATNDLSALLADAPRHTYAQALAIDDRAHRDAHDASVAFGITAGFAAVTAAVATYDVLRARPRRTEQLTIAPTRGGAAIACEVAF